jgi:hypothetical protein
MHSSFPIARARRRCAALLAAAVLASCHESPVDPSTRVNELRPFGSGLQVMAGAQWLVKVLVVDAGGSPVSGVSVTWQTSSGVLAKTVTSSSTEGVASNLWTAPLDPGQQIISASVGSADVQPLQMVVVVTPGPVATLKILADTVHFTAQRQPRTVRVVGRDGHGNPVALGYSELQVSGSWLSAVAMLPSSGDTATVVLTSGDGSHLGYVWVALDGVRDSVPLILQPVSTGVQAISGLDSVAGLIVGQHATVQVIGVDSLGHPIPGIDPTASGLQLSSSAPDILSVSNDGRLVGVAAGRAVVTASAGSVSNRVTVPVFTELEVGTRLATFDLAPGIDQQSEARYLSDAGLLYSLHSFWGHNPGPTRLEAYGKDGRLNWTHTASSNPYLNVLNPASGTMFSADAGTHVIRALGPTGIELWTFDYGSFTTMGCLLAGWGDSVAAWCGSYVLALRGNGSVAWSAPMGGAPWRILTTPTHVVAQSRDSLSAFDANGMVAWTRSVTASEMIADASSNVYLMEQGGVRAIDGNGVDRWFTPTPLGACIIATTDHLVICRDNSLLVALDPADGHVRWSTTIPIPFGCPVAISGDRLLVLGGHLFALDARSGAVIARSAESYDNYLLSVADGFMSMSMPSYAITFSTPFSPGSEWSQASGNAGHGNSVTP